MVNEIVGHPGSLYFSRIGQDRISLMFIAKNTFLGTFVFLFLVHILKKLCISWDLLDSVKKWHIQFDRIEHLEYLFHFHVLIVVLKPIRKGCYRLMNLFSSFVLVRCLWSRLGGASRGGVESMWTEFFYW